MKRKIIDKLRMAEWAFIAVVLLLILAVTAPQQIPVFIYKANLVAFFAFMGYWLDRRLYPWTRPVDEDGNYRPENANKQELRRAIIVAAVIIGGALAL